MADFVVYTNVSEATVIFAGQTIMTDGHYGAGSAWFVVNPGTYSLHVEKAGYQSVDTSATAYENPTSVSITLSPLPVAYCCPICVPAVCFATPQQLEGHMIDVHGGLPFCCTICANVCFATQEQLAAHMASAHPTPTPPLELDLPTCGGIALAIACLALVGYYVLTQAAKTF